MSPLAILSAALRGLDGQVLVLAHRLPKQLGERARQPWPAAIFAGKPCEVSLPAPALGEHTDEVFASLGHSAQALAALRAAGVLG